MLFIIVIFFSGNSVKTSFLVLLNTNGDISAFNLSSAALSSSLIIGSSIFFLNLEYEYKYPGIINQLAGGFHVVVLAEAVVAGNELHVVGIAIN